MGRLFNNNLFLQEGNGGGGTGTTNYNDLTNKPKVNGIVLSGNKTSADLGITTLTPFPSTWPTTGKFEDLLAAIRADTIAVKGASFLGEVTFDDLPANLGNAEIKIEILEGTTSATKVIHSVITSGNREPYRWEYTSWNSGNSNSGWISFQLPLTAGTGISIENNVISATGGGSSTTISTVLNNQSTDATASSSKAVWDKVKVLEDNPVYGNDDFLITGTGVLVTDSRYSREFTKTKEGIAYGMVYANTSGYDGPILVSEDKDIVIYTPGGQLGGSFELYGKTWYYSATEFFVEHSTSFTLGLIKVNTASERTFNTLDAAKYVIENGYSYIEKGLITKVNNLTTNVNNMAPIVQEAYTKTNIVAGKNITIDEVLPAGGIDNHTLACWHFDDDFKDVVAEKVINNGELSLVSKFGSHSYSFTFTSITNEVISLQLWKDLTIDFFVRLGSDSSSFVWDGIFSGYSPQTLLAVQKDKVYLATASGTGKYVNLTNPISINEWHHVAYVHDSSSSTVKVYIDGSMVANESVTYPEVAFSACNFNGSTPWNIDELRISDIVRPLDEDGKFPVPTQPYSVAEPTGKVAINNAITKTSQLTNDSGFITSVPENLVTTDTEQEITGAKSFESPITFSNNNGALNFMWRGSGLRVSGSDSNIYVGNTGYPLVLESSEPVKMNGKQLATIDDVSVNGKTRAITLTGADIQTTYTANPDVAETTTSDINTALTAICEDIHNVLTNVPTGAEIMNAQIADYQAPLATEATLADVIAKVNAILTIMSERGIMGKNS